MSLTITKKAVITTIGIGVFAIGFYSYRKYKAAKTIIEKIKVRPKDIKNIKVGFNTTRFTIALELFNDTVYDLGFTTGSIIILKKIRVFTPLGQLIADVDTNISSLEITAFDKYTLPDLQVEIQTQNLLNQFGNITKYIHESSLQYDLTIKAFGKDFTITT